MFQNALATNSKGGGEFRFRHADGHYLWLECVGNVLVGDDGKACGTILASRDITERKQRDAQMHLQVAALEAAANGIVITDRKGDIAWVNPAYTRMTGYALDEVRGKNPRVLSSGKHDQAFYADLWRTILSGEVWRGEVINRRKNGDLYFDEMTITPVCADGNGITHFVAIKNDVTERKRVEDTLRLSEERLRNSFVFAGIAMGVTDLTGRFLQVNPACCTMLGYSEDELLNSSFQEITHPDDLNEDLKKHAELLAGTISSYQIEKRNIDKAGRTLWVLKTTSAVRDPDGRPLQILAQVQDVTGRKQAEIELRLSEERFRRITTNMLDVVTQINPEGIFEYITPSVLSVLGFRPEDLIGQSLISGVHPDDLEHAIATLGTVIQTDAPNGGGFRYRNGRGDYTWLEVIGKRLLNDQGVISGVLIACRDVTARKQAEDEIRTLNAELEERVRNRTTQLEAANNEMEAFAYSVSHDLRAPLRAIDGFSQALLEDYHAKLDVEGQDCLRRVRAATQRMGRLIDDILHLSQMTRSAMTREKVDLSALAAHVIADLHAAEPNRHDVCIDIDPGLVSEGDPRLLEVVLTNLLGNAWKFTSKTENARIEFGATDRDGQRAFFVRDNGAGFDMANADRLFGAFQRLHTEAEFPGTGIGLATVQRIIRRHGGQVWAEGSIGKGATFAFTLGPFGGAS